MAQIFISYKNSERGEISKIANALIGEGYTVWWDNSLIGGQDYSRIIDAEIAAATVVMPVWSRESVHSNWVSAEAERGSTKLFPVRIDEVSPPLPFNKLHTLDLSGWTGDVNDPRWQRLVVDLRAILSGPARGRLQSLPAARAQRTGARRAASLALIVGIAAVAVVWWVLRDQRSNADTRPPAQQQATADGAAAASATSPTSESLGMRALDALNTARRDGNYSAALAATEVCVAQLRDEADATEARLRASRTPVLAARNIGSSDQDRNEIHARGALNEVGACLFVSVAANVARREREAAQRSYVQLCAYPHALVWDPTPPGWFWSPLEGAAQELRSAGVVPTNCPA